MPTKATMKDVAREAGVSIATVSYILNNRQDQKITEATRKKVLQMANLLGYTPNPTAKSLAMGRKNLIGIVYRRRDDTPSRSQELFYFLDLLVRGIAAKGIDSILLPAGAHETAMQRVESVITVDLGQAEFAALSDNCYSPILAVDMLVNPDLFFRIYSDLPRCMGTPAPGTLLIREPYGNEPYNDFVSSLFPADQVLSPAECTPDRRGNAPLLILGAGLALSMGPLDGAVSVIASDPTGNLLPPSYQVLWNDVAAKADRTVQYLQEALAGRFDAPHDVPV